MSVPPLSAPCLTTLRLRRLAWRDWPQVRRLAERAKALSWAVESWPALLRSHEVIGCVAEVRNRIVGLALCLIEHRPAGTAGGLVGRLRSLLGRLSSRGPRRTFSVERFEIVLLPDQANSGVERALLLRLEAELRRTGDCVRLVVPESDLPAQLFLREAGFRATAVLHGYYGDQDGYAMVRGSGCGEAAGLQPVGTQAGG